MLRYISEIVKPPVSRVFQASHDTPLRTDRRDR